MTEGQSLGTIAFHILAPAHIFLVTFLIIPILGTIILLTFLNTLSLQS